jgi:hypothetical protein
VLHFATFKSTLGFEGCNLCADGSTITNPDYFIDFFEWTCQDASNNLLDEVDRESLHCRQARFFACCILWLSCFA